tara:strand:+ start:2452 stop:3729 length:1278 start_codon:yes stop_codon:yes gene_type:complete
MFTTTKRYINFSYFINFLISVLPISFIAGNLIINLNIILIILSSLLYYKNKIFAFKLLLIDKLIISLFFFTIITALLNNFFSIQMINSINEYNVLIKTLLFQRFLVLYFVVRYLIYENVLNLKSLFISASFCALFVCGSLMYEFIVQYDNLKSPYKLSGPFGDEYIAGSYLQRFSIFAFFLIPVLFYNKDKKYILLALSVLFIFIFFSMIVAGNRMPIILFFLMFIFLFFIEKKLRKYSVIFITSVILFFVLILFLIPEFYNYTKHFYDRVIEIIVFFTDIIMFGKEPKITNTYLNEFYSGYAVWKNNFLIGGGIDSFYSNCVRTVDFCATHPHNYYLEILSELGMVGFVLCLIIFFIIIKEAVFQKRYLKANLNYNYVIPFIIIFMVEIFPVKTSGSFFTTGTSSYFFLILAITVGLNNKLKSN